MVVASLRQVINVCDNPQALHTLQQWGWEGFKAPELKILQGKDLHLTLCRWHLTVLTTYLSVVFVAWWDHQRGN